jgi:hypothetical protein
MRIGVERHRLASVSELRGKVRYRQSLADFHAGIAVAEDRAVSKAGRPAAWHPLRIACPSTWRVAPANTRRSGVRSSGATVWASSSMSHSGTVTQRRAAAVFPPRIRKREFAESTSCHSSLASSPARSPVCSRIRSASRHFGGALTMIAVRCKRRKAPSGGPFRFSQFATACRGGLKILCPQGRVSSTLTPGI